jgi:two-component system, chemotaxis family, sensor kinase CheA
MRIDLTQYRATFFEEAGEHLAALEAALLRLDIDPNDPTAMGEAFRAAHSIKGGSDAVGFPDVARFTHALEGLLDRFRGATGGPVPRRILDLLLEAADSLAGLVAAARTGGEPLEVAETLAKLAGAIAEPVTCSDRTTYRVTVVPHPDALRNGLDPLLLIRQLTQLGTVSSVRLDAGALPALADLDPERCYLSWAVRLETDCTPAAIADVFAFAPDMVRATIEPEGPPAGAAPPHEAPAAPTAADVAFPEENAGMMSDFCSEADEHLEAADRCLLTLDAEPTNAEALNAVYRAFHSIKGVSGMLDLDGVQTLAHEAENLLNLARDGSLVLRGKALDLAFASADALKRQVRFVRNWMASRGRLEKDPALPQLLVDLRAAAHAPGGSAPKEPAPLPTKVEAPAPRRAAPAGTPPAEPAARRPVAVDKETVRVDRDRLDKLINTIGELVIAQAMAQEEFDELTQRTGAHSRALPELSKISRDLQELSLSLRMVPLQGTFQKMARLVRDLSRKMDKPVDLELHGEETELDKTVVDQLGDPLIHMVRNAVDHGLEPPGERAAVGKPLEGRVTLRAYHQGGSVYIELTDDGKGLDRDRILRKAVEKGLVNEGQRLTDAEIYALIFEPGFSTAKAVTDVSGRGVGMDVVRRNVQALHGSIDIRTQLGKGTTFAIRLPLTLAIIDGLMVGLGGDVYLLPLLSVVESFRPRPAEVHTVAARGEAVTVRGEVVPLLRLSRLLGRPGAVTDPGRGLVVIVEDHGKKHALLVDELLGQMQAVVKSLDANYRRVEGLAGATILGDGRVAMILDVHGLILLHAQIGGDRRTVPFAAGSNESLGEFS